MAFVALGINPSAFPEPIDSPWCDACPAVGSDLINYRFPFHSLCSRHIGLSCPPEWQANSSGTFILGYPPARIFFPQVFSYLSFYSSLMWNVSFQYFIAWHFKLVPPVSNILKITQFYFLFSVHITIWNSPDLIF